MMKILSNPLIAILLLLVLITTSFLVLSIASQSTMERVDWCEETYRVQSGDSLWIISREFVPDCVDRREWIEDVRQRNGLTSEFIYPGQTLTVLAPVEEVGQ